MPQPAKTKAFAAPKKGETRIFTRHNINSNSMIYVMIADGFEEIEALTVVDVLRRAGLDTRTVSITAKKEAEGAHGITIATDATLEAADFGECGLVVLPGGMPGALNLRKSGRLCDLLEKTHAAGKPIAAICAAPYILGELGMLEGRRATCYPGFESKLKGAECTGAFVERDGNIITGKGPAAALPFALAIVETLAGKGKAEEVARGMLLTP